LVVIPTASKSTSTTDAEHITTWQQRGIGHVSVLHTQDREQANQPEFVAPLKNATAVWFGGGRQRRLSEAYSGTAVERELVAVLRRGGVVGGTSAGAAIQSKVMIQSGGPTPVIAQGLDLAKGVIIDQHFLARNRLPRLIEATRTHPDRLGIGVAESTAALIRNDHMQVIGRSHVVVVTPKTVGRPMDVQAFDAADGEIDLKAFRPDQDRVRWAIVLHGGAGTIDRDRPAEEIQACKHGLVEALDRGKRILRDGGTSLAAVETVIRSLEDNPLFNAGRGAVFTHDGEHELDASIMEGRSLGCGAVAGVRTVKNPISLARLVMEKPRHVLLSGDGADRFAAEMGVEQVPQEYFSTDRRRQQLKKALDREAESGNKQTQQDLGAKLTDAQKYGTVGCVALDVHGNITAGTSTGGRTNKMPGRVGDSPVIGAGTYANNSTCGLSATGAGEEFIRHAVTAQISLLMEHGGFSLQDAAEFVLKNRLHAGDGGIIGIDWQGRIVSVYTTAGMYRASANADGRNEVKIWDE
jgi:L-asparaginase / beta-aspartyl-peptidase